MMSPLSLHEKEQWLEQNSVEQDCVALVNLGLEGIQIPYEQPFPVESEYLFVSQFIQYGGDRLSGSGGEIGYVLMCEKSSQHPFIADSLPSFIQGVHKILYDSTSGVLKH